MPCEHTRLKRNYPFGHNSKPTRVCKSCKIIMTGKEIIERRENAKKRNRRR